MKKLFIAALIFVFFGSGLVYAADNVGLLPSNPFYFLKEWRRETQKLLAFNSAKRAELELQILNERAAELWKLAELNLSNAKALEKAKKSYHEAIVNIKAIDFFDRLIKHSEFTAGLIGDSSNQNSAGILTENLAVFLDNNVVQPSDNLKAILILDNLKQFSGLREDLLLEFQGLVKVAPEALNDLGLASADLIQLLDEVREEVADGSEAKNNLNLARQKILDLIKEKHSVRKPEVERLIAKIDALISGLEDELKNNPGLAKAKFNLDQARVSLENNQYADAFGQASIAAAAIKNAITQSAIGNLELETDIRALKQKYDQLTLLAKAKELAKDSEIFKILNKLEKNLVKAADLLSAQARIESLKKLIKEVKLQIFEVKYFLNRVDK